MRNRTTGVPPLIPSPYHGHPARALCHARLAAPKRTFTLVQMLCTPCIGSKSLTSSPNPINARQLPAICYNCDTGAIRTSRPFLPIAPSLPPPNNLS